MKKSIVSTLAAAGMFFSFAQPYNVLAEAPPFFQYGSDELEVSQVAQYDSLAGEGGTEIMAFDEESGQAFVTNGAESGLDILNFSGLESGEFRQVDSSKRIHVEDFGLDQVDDITSVASHPSENVIALSVVSDPKTDPGYIVFLTKSGDYINHVQVGALPDMVTFTPDGSKVLVANEGEPNDDYSEDPEGSISLIDVTGGISEEKELRVKTLTFEERILDEKVRVDSKGTVQQQLEPEYITVSDDSRTAYAVLQENNAIAEMDLETETIKSVKGLGIKDHSIAGNELDAKENGEMEIENLPLLGWYMPDAIDTFSAGGKTYILTPNEGDARDYEAYSEEMEIGDIIDNIELNADHYEGYSQEELDGLVEDGLLEEMEDTELTAENGMNDDGVYEVLYSYGGRSFSIFDADTMELVYDSGSEIEHITAEAMPEYFNTNNDEIEFDGRSDAKGPEPETTVIGEINGTPYAFTALERFSAVMVYDISNPADAEFVTMISSRDFNEDVAGDVAPEGLSFIPAEDSPTGSPLLAATHELSGTVAVYEFLQTIEDDESPEEPSEGNYPFIDVDKDYWAYPYIKELYENSVITGKTDSTFDPSAEVTRAQFAVMISNALNIEAESAADSEFDDVPEWAQAQIQAVFEAGITTGKSDGTFAPNEPITREQMAAMTIRAYEHAEKEQAKRGDLVYSDENQISDYAVSAVQKAQELKIMTGTKEGMFQPKENSTRAHAAKVVSLLIKEVEK
ncbi:choice-of-anchor I family protein [Alteribacillus sp. YIM 98480]|uniref:choice-of-anchor I family protein n=1 Tax=Alteribacillus sp. YIM 98480 TaxID=2606599 RepID=UPI00131C7E23|nr:choice-of-anchor I family protein [Alteribacillus sp. YIM 98480]